MDSQILKIQKFLLRNKFHVDHFDLQLNQHQSINTLHVIQCYYIEIPHNFVSQLLRT